MENHDWTVPSEAGDVELAQFRRIGSFDVSSRSTRPGPVDLRAGAKDYLGRDPLSMFHAEKEEQEIEQAWEDVGGVAAVESTEGFEGAADGTAEGLAGVGGNPWRNAVVTACAGLLGKSLDELTKEHVANVSSVSNSAFGSLTDELAPRDVADFVIMTTLKARDAFATQNATCWLFNIMDRTGAAYVLRDEFVRYAPFMSPVADAAVAGEVFDELVAAQARNTEAEAATDGKRDPVESTRARVRRGIRSYTQRRGPEDAPTDAEPLRPGRFSREPAATSSRASSTSDTDSPPSCELFPPGSALRFDTWRRYFAAIQSKSRCSDDEWPRVKQELGLDPDEILIKSQGAVHHNDLFPTLGKLYVSQRYLVFFAAVGRNHYVARLGAVSEVSATGIPLLMRDCIEVRLESETKTAMDGVSSLVKDSLTNVNGGTEPGSGSKGSVETSKARDDKVSSNQNTKQEPTLSQHVGDLMKQFTAGDKALVFSLLEFRETKRRDHWLCIIRELAAAHKLHVQLGFGSKGRAAPSASGVASVGNEIVGSSHTAPGQNASDTADEAKKRASSSDASDSSRNYMLSPFRNEPYPPLLVVAAHSNIVRYRAVRQVSETDVSSGLLVFSNAQRKSKEVNWYIDSVRVFQNFGGRSWIERAMTAIRDNMDLNDRIYRVQDDLPFDVGLLGDGIGRFAELCAPFARVIEFFLHLSQWRNPPASILFLVALFTFVRRGWVKYIPAMIMFMQAGWIVETKMNIFGVTAGNGSIEDAKSRQANVLALVAQVHDTLHAAQNVIMKMNRELGKVQALFLWGGEEWYSWVTVGVIVGIGFVLLIVPFDWLFVGTVTFSFVKHFLPPNNPVLRVWQTLPSRIQHNSGTPDVPDRSNSATAASPFPAAVGPSKSVTGSKEKDV